MEKEFFAFKHRPPDGSAAVAATRPSESARTLEGPRPAGPARGRGNGRLPSCAAKAVLQRVARQMLVSSRGATDASSARPRRRCSEWRDRC
jgi:hypothetical protein